MKLTSKLASTLALFSAFSLSVTSAFAQIINPAIQGDLGNDPAAAADGSTFARYFVYLWNAVLIVGGLTTVIFFIQGAIEWIAAGGDSGKLQEARNRMLNAAIGIFILVSMYTIINFISPLLFGDQFSLLRFSIPSPN